MSLTLHLHPLSSYCQKAVVALYETGTPFTPHVVDFSDAAATAAYKAIWPVGKIPVLRDEARGETVPEATVIIEYLATHYPGKTTLVPRDPDLAWNTRLKDRFYDHYVNDPVGKVVADRLRPAGKTDPHGVETARALLATSLAMVDKEMGTRQWAAGDIFTMADCAAAPALFYADMIMPLGQSHPNAARYLDRLKARPSFARALDEAKPYLDMMPT